MSNDNAGGAATRVVINAGPYRVDAYTRWVEPSDPYAGMRAADCNEPMAPKTPAVLAEDGSAVSFSPGFLRQLGVMDGQGPLPWKYLFLDSESPEAGRACINLEDEQTTALRSKALEQVNCAALPEGDAKACEALKYRISQYTPPKEPGVGAKLADGTIIGTGFALSAMALNWLASKLTGKSILDRIRNGDGKPKDPPPPDAPASGGGGGSRGAEAPKSAREGTDAAAPAPSKFVTVDSEPMLPKPTFNALDPVQVKAEYGILAGIAVLLLSMVMRVAVPATNAIGIMPMPGQQKDDGMGIGHGVPMA